MRTSLIMMVATIANAIIIFVTFVIFTPAIIMPMATNWLKVHGYMVLLCAVFTLVLGLDIWYGTLQTRNNLFAVWSAVPTSTQSLLQQKVRD
jgi:hypothetical protein